MQDWVNSDECLPELVEEKKKKNKTFYFEKGDGKAFSRVGSSANSRFMKKLRWDDHVIRVGDMWE